MTLALPGAFAAYKDVFRDLSRVGMLFIVGGVCTLLSCSARSRWSGAIPVSLGALGALPWIIMAVMTLIRAPVWPAPIVGAVLGIGVLADAWRPLPGAVEERRSVPSLAIAAAALAAANGATAISAPALLHLESSLRLLAYLPHIGGSLVGAAGLLVVGWLIPRLRTATQILAAVPLLVFAALFVPLGRWLAVLIFGLLAVFLAFEPALHALLQQRMAQRREESRPVADYELASEAAAWGFVLLIAIAGAVETMASRRLALFVLVLVVSLFTFTWFHLLSVRDAGLRRSVWGIAAFSVMVVVLVELTGALHSAYFFVYALPIIGLAWTRAPQAVVVPTAIPLVALLIETAFAFRTGADSLEMILALAVPRAGGLLLVAGFSYMLARRNLAEQTRSRRAHGQLQAVVSNMGEGLVTADEYGQVTLCNPAAIALLGCKPASHDQLLTDVMPLTATDGSPLRSGEHPVRRALAGHQVPWTRLLATTPHGPVPVAVAATPLAGSPGPAGAIVLLRDVRGEVETERVREDFFFIASHELRTPLTVMKGNLEMALEVVPAGPLKITLDEALRSATRLIRMVNDFLDAARLEHGSLTVRLEDAPLPDLVQQAVETLKPDAERKGLTMTYHPTPGLQAVRMDSERTLQILLNLLGNSVRYTNSGQIEVWHEVRDGTVETLIRDSGIGIAPEHQERLFTRFGQVERGLTRVTSGTGLGLYISQKLAEQMGGTVVLKQSAPGKGSTFALILPTAGAAGPVALSPGDE